jgi:hypothetical protein
VVSLPDIGLTLSIANLANGYKMDKQVEFTYRTLALWMYQSLHGTSEPPVMRLDVTLHRLQRHGIEGQSAIDQIYRFLYGESNHQHKKTHVPLRISKMKGDAQRRKGRSSEAGQWAG